VPKRVKRKSGWSKKKWRIYANFHYIPFAKPKEKKYEKNKNMRKNLKIFIQKQDLAKNE
jgi:hypothetical protein